MVSSLAGRVLKLLAAHSLLPYRDLEKALDFTKTDVDSVADLLPTLKSLVDNGLIQTNSSLAMLVAKSLDNTDD